MTMKERALRAIQALPDDATIEEAIAQLRRVGETASQPSQGTGAPSDAWALLDELAGSAQAPADWAAEHDHYLYGTPKRGSAA